jgi:hypothetical protein
LLNRDVAVLAAASTDKHQALATTPINRRAGRLYNICNASLEIARVFVHIAHLLQQPFRLAR